MRDCNCCWEFRFYDGWRSQKTAKFSIIRRYWFFINENVHLLLYTTLHPASGGYRIGENIKQDICVCVNFTYLKVAAADFAALLGNDFLNGSWMLQLKDTVFKKLGRMNVQECVNLFGDYLLETNRSGLMIEHMPKYQQVFHRVPALALYFQLSRKVYICFFFSSFFFHFFFLFSFF